MTRSLLLTGVVSVVLLTSNSIVAQVRQDGFFLHRTYLRTPTETTEFQREDSHLGPWHSLVPATRVNCPDDVTCVFHMTLSFTTDDLSIEEVLSLRVFVDSSLNLAWPFGSFLLNLDDYGPAVFVTGTDGSTANPEPYPKLKHRHHTLQFVRRGIPPGSHLVYVQGKLLDSFFDPEDDNHASVLNKVLKIDVYR